MYKSSENHISQGKLDLNLKLDAVIAKLLVFLTDERIEWLLPYLPPANEVWGKVIFLHLFVILFTGGSASVHAGRPLQRRHPPGGDPSPREETPLAQIWSDMVGDTVNAWVVRILLECNLVDDCVFPP